MRYTVDDQFHKSWVARHKLLTAAILVCASLVGVWAYTTRPMEDKNPYLIGKSSAPSQPVTEENAPTAVSPIKSVVGQTALDGALRLTVDKVSCGDRKIGTNEYAHDEAAGIFCRVQMSAENTTGQNQSLPIDKARLYDDRGSEHEVDTAATTYTGADLTATPWYESITGNTVSTGEIVFDLPETAKPDRIVLYGGRDTQGLEIDIP